MKLINITSLFDAIIKRLSDNSNITRSSICIFLVTTVEKLEVHRETCQTSKKDRFANKVNRTF